MISLARLQQLPRNQLAVGAGCLLVLIAVGITWAVYANETHYVTATVQRGDIHQTVEAVGTVISENDLGLQFRSAGIVAEVLVHEGDTVVAGQRLAALRAQDIGASVAAAAAQAREAEAALRTLQEGTRPEELAIAEAQLDGKRISLETAKTIRKTAGENLVASQAKLAALKQEADTALSGQVGMAATVAAQKMTTAEQALGSIDDVYNSNDVSDAVIGLNSADYSALRERVSAAKATIASAKLQPTPTDYLTALGLADTAHIAIQKAIDSLSGAYDFMVILPETSSLSRSNREAYKNTLALKRSTAQSALAELETWTKSLRDAAAVYDTRIATEESALATAKGTEEKAQADIASYEIAIRIDEANLALKRAGPRQTEIDAARARLQAAQANTARASASYADTQIIAPIAGRITKVAITAGEMAPSGPSIMMIGNSPYRIEALLSEANILQVRHFQSGSIILDVIPDTKYALVLHEIDEAPTIRNGQEQYRVKLDFVYPHDDFKIGMSGDLTIATKTREDVLLVPSASIEKKDDKTVVRVLDERGHITEAPVTVGMHDAVNDLTEITSGLQEGDTVILSQE